MLSSEKRNKPKIKDDSTRRVAVGEAYVLTLRDLVAKANIGRNVWHGTRSVEGSIRPVGKEEEIIRKR